MKIGFQYNEPIFPPTTGGSVHGYQLAKGLAERGHKLSSWYYGDASPFTTHYRGRQILRFLPSVDLLYIRVNLDAATARLSLLRLLRCPQIPVVWELNGLPEELLYKGRTAADASGLTRTLRFYARFADAAIGVTQGITDYLREDIGVQIVSCIPNGSDPILFSPASERSFRDAVLTVAWIGTSSCGWHDLDALVAAARQLHRRRARVKFLIYGDASHLPPGLPPNIVPCGLVSYTDMGKQLAKADVGLHLFRPLPNGHTMDALPLKLFDYMACGLAIIAQDSGEKGEVIRRWHCGLFTSGQPNDLAEKILMLERDRQLCRDLGAGGRRAVAEYYNWSRAVRQTDAILHEVVDVTKQSRVHARASPALRVTGNHFEGTAVRTGSVRTTDQRRPSEREPRRRPTRDSRRALRTGAQARGCHAKSIGRENVRGARRKRVVYIEEGGGFGGAVTVLAYGLAYLSALGYECHVVLTYLDPRAETALGAAHQVHLLPFDRRPPYVRKRLEGLAARSSWLKLPYLLGVSAKEAAAKGLWLIRLCHLLRRIRPDIVHCNNGPQYNAAAALLARLMGFPIVVSVRGPDGRTWLARLVEKFCNAEVFVSEHLRRAMAPRNRCATVVHDGLDMSAWPLPQKHAGRSGTLRVGHVGMFTPWKGQDVFIRAAALVASRSKSVEFYLVGDVISDKGRAYGAELRRLAESSGYADRIHFLGFQSEMRRVLLDLDVVVHSSISPEPLGTVVLEGMATARAVIASDEGGPREMIRHGVEGLLVRPRDPQALADAIALLVQSPEMIESLGEAARRRFEEDFRAKLMVDRFGSLYEQLLCR